MRGSTCCTLVTSNFKVIQNNSMKVGFRQTTWAIDTCQMPNLSLYLCRPSLKQANEPSPHGANRIVTTGAESRRTISCIFEGSPVTLPAIWPSSNSPLPFRCPMCFSPPLSQFKRNIPDNLYWIHQALDLLPFCPVVLGPAVTWLTRFSQF